MPKQNETTDFRAGLPQRLRGEWATLTTDEAADTWALRREAADEIERLRRVVERALDAVEMNEKKLRVANFEGKPIMTEKTTQITDLRLCTCHPSEAPVPCQHKYAHSDCVSAAEAQPKTTA